MAARVAIEDIDLDFVPRPIRPAAQVEVDGEEVLYVDDPPALFTLSATARVVWHCLDGEVSLSALASDLAEVFEVEESTVASDLLGLCRDLGAQGLLENVEPDPETRARHELTPPRAAGEPR